MYVLLLTDCCFASGRLELDPPTTAITPQAVVQSHVLVLGMSDGCVVRWALDGSREPESAYFRSSCPTLD